MQDRANWMEQISKRNDDELRRWTEEITNPRLLTLAMTELSLRSVRRLNASLTEFGESSERLSQRIAFLAKALIWLTVVLIIVCLPSAISESRRLLGREEFPTAQFAQPARAAAVTGVAAEKQCGDQAKLATEQFTRTQRERQANFRLLSSRSHYNKQLHKCFVEIRTFSGVLGVDAASGNYVLDTDDNSIQLYCLTPERPDPNVRFGRCFDRKQNSLQREDADKQILQIMER